MAPNRPVLLTGLVDDWPALNWTFEGMAETFGEYQLQFTEYYQEQGRRAARKRRSTLAQFIARMVDPEANGSLYWTAFDQAEDDPLVAQLEKGIRYPEGYCDPASDEKTVFFLGPEGTRSGLHFDPSNVLLVQVMGSKKVWLYPPQDIPDAYLGREFYSPVEAENPDLARHPRFQEAAEPLVFDLHPGETLFLPVGWLHHVRSLSPSLSVSMSCLRLPTGERNTIDFPSRYQVRV